LRSRVVGMSHGRYQQEHRQHKAQSHPMHICNAGAERRFADFGLGVRNGFADPGAPLPSAAD